jgi:hypothetical protein
MLLLLLCRSYGNRVACVLYSARTRKLVVTCVLMHVYVSLVRDTTVYHTGGLPLMLAAVMYVVTAGIGMLVLLELCSTSSSNHYSSSTSSQCAEETAERVNGNGNVQLFEVYSSHNNNL